MSFQQALSGLSAASTNLDTIGNNVANANTVGFKDARAEFADLFSSALNGGSNSQLGQGARVAQIAQQFTQGNLQTTNNPLDTGINGNGFFRTSTNGTISYSRDGQFQVNAQGYLVNSTGAQITGYPASATGAIQTGSPVPLQINTAGLLPTATSTSQAVLNLNSGSSVPTVATFNANNPSSYNNSTSQTIYDSLGNPHTMTSYYQLQAVAPAAVPPVAAGTWNVYATLDGVPMTVTTPGVPPTTGANGQIIFNAAGGITNSGSLPFTLTSGALTTSATTPLVTTFDLTGTTQYGAPFSVSNLQQNGTAPGNLTGFSIGADGTIEGSYSNGHAQALGQLVMASFIDPNGLQATGNNSWNQTVASGDPLVSTPGSGTLGTLQSSSLEQSNVDLTAELVNMITAQRNYQANAQTIKTQDQIMQTITSLR